ncbi:MAG: RNA-binding domain-containing protein [Armatimonadota bacterium]
MTKEELLERLAGYEWNDVEFKLCQGGVSNAAYETVSAFANTAGGWLVFGVRESGGTYEIVGVLEVDRVQNDFLSCLRSGQKLSVVVDAAEQMLSHEGKTLLVFYIPEARRQVKPVHLGHDLGHSYVRRGGCDERCTEEQVRRFVRNAADGEYDGEALDLDPEHFFDPDSVRWYRSLHSSNDERLSDLEYLSQWGFVKEVSGGLLPTRAGALVFGAEDIVRQVLPRPVLDCQWIAAGYGDDLPLERWRDRLLVEANLLHAWRSFVHRYGANSETPFALDQRTLQREENPPDYIAVREAAINLLIHQDYGDHRRVASIQFFSDCTLLRNPGDADSPPEDLLEPGPKAVRNPSIVNAFRRIGLSEQAGTGVRAIYWSWRQLGRVPPTIRNDKFDGSFGISLPKRALLSEEQVLFQAGIGVHLGTEEAKAFALACQQERLRLADVKAVTGLSGIDAQAVLDRLVTQALMDRFEASPQPYYAVKAQFRERFSAQAAGAAPPPTARVNLSSDQVPTTEARLITAQVAPLKELSETQWRILDFCDVPQSLASIMTHVGLTHRVFFKRKHLDPMLMGGVLQMRYPEQPNHPEQAYVLTEAGVELKARRLASKTKNGSGGG